MHFFITTTGLIACALTSAAAAAPTAPSLNTSQEFYLQTEVKPGQSSDKTAAFDNLWVYGYHTGAGTNDVALSANASHRLPAWLGASNLTTNTGTKVYSVDFDLNTPDIPWSLTAADVNYYAGWQPVRLNAGVDVSVYNAFFVNETGLQFTDAVENQNAEGFAGWLVCKWWHGDIDGQGAAPQLFYRLNGFGHVELETCADVYLKPVYI